MNIQQWSEWLKRLGADDGHKWLCWASSDPSNLRIEIVEGSKPSAKIPLSLFIKNTQKTLENRVILSDLHHIDAFSTNYENEVTEKIKLVLEQLDQMNTIFSTLEKMCQRAKQKRLDEATKSIWGKIKWYIWSWFCDNSRTLHSIKKEIVLYSREQAIQETADILRTRILMNIDGVQSSLEPSFDICEPYNEYKTPADVRRKWLTEYSADRYPNLNPRADEQRTRVIALTRIWDNLLKEFKDNPSEPRNLPPKDSQPQLLTMGGL